MDEALHIAGRSIIHFTAATGLVIWALFGLRLACKRSKAISHALPSKLSAQLILVCLVVVLVAFAREPWDVEKGGSLVKSYIDLVSWIAGSVLAYFSAWYMIKIEEK